MCVQGGLTPIKIRKNSRANVPEAGRQHKTCGYTPGRMYRKLADSIKSVINGVGYTYELPHPIRIMRVNILKSKTKAEALRILHNSAVAYKNNLLNRNVMFVASKNEIAQLFETKFLPSNFKHLTGIISSLNSTRFFEAAVNNKLKESEINFARDGTTHKKLDVLFSLMSIHKTAKMAGDFEGSHKVLLSDKIAGTTTAVMGFIKDDKFFVPNTIIKDDVRQLTRKPTLVINAIFIKSDKQIEYNQISFLRSGTTVEQIIKLIPDIKCKLLIDKNK